MRTHVRKTSKLEKLVDKMANSKYIHITLGGLGLAIILVGSTLQHFSAFNGIEGIAVSGGMFIFGFAGLVWARKREVPLIVSIRGYPALFFAILYTSIWWGFGLISLLRVLEKWFR